MNCLTLSLVLLLPAADPQPKDKAAAVAAPVGADLKLRHIGPALTSGRISGFAVHPRNRAHYYVAVASGGVWKTVNDGVTWTPIFDNEGSYSIGAITLDPKNPNVVWVGTGENNNQRSVGYGDGVYKSIDGGKTWQNVGLKQSEHIGRILIDPRDSDTVLVAAQGPLWGSGGDRGLYKTTDGGKTWNQILRISENTGVTDVSFDPRNPDIILAAAHQRRRHVWTLIHGGPESALHRSTDGGKSWNKVKAGLPETELGRIGLAVAPTEPDTVYAIVEAAEKKGGIFRSKDRGVTWEKRNDFDRQAQYYSHIVVDPKNADRLYVMNVYVHVSDDGGKTLRRLGEKWKHVDTHTLWVDPNDNDYYRAGCDGGIYESFDRGANWQFKANLPVTQFYQITVDESGPFYHVYGGTQDNFTLGGPARSKSAHGIMNQDWFVVQDGDGFQCKVDPKDPNIVYGEAQYGILCRFDRRTGQRVQIQPQPGKGEPPLRWNWDSPLIISPHSNTRLYFAGNKLFRSDDRGDSWKAISGDLTRQLDRDKLPVMGKIWGPDAVAKHLSTSFYGNCTMLAESPKKEGLLYVGTDDGLIHVSENAGETWRKIEKFPNVPENTYVSRIVASQHDANTVYAGFNNHKTADFAPYLLKSTDAGKTWTSIASDLPPRGSVWALAEDHINPHLLFVGTEFGLFVTQDGGKKWHRLKSGLPTIAVRDLAIQRKMNDLVVGTFGRGFYVLDDYTPLREAPAERQASLLPIRDAVLYIPTMQYGIKGKAFLGESLYTAENPPYGAIISYTLKDTLKTRKQIRQDAEKEAVKRGEPFAYPTKEQLRAEAEEEEPAVIVTILDEANVPIRRLTGPVKAGLHRISWDLRDTSPILPPTRTEELDPWVEEEKGALILPGTYKASLAIRTAGTTTVIGEPRAFEVVVDGTASVPLADLKELRTFHQDVTKLRRNTHGILNAANELTTKLEQARKALDQAPAADAKSRELVRAMIQKNREILRGLRGDTALRSRYENTPISISERVEYIVEASRLALAKPTGTARESYRIANEELKDALTSLRKLIEVDGKELDKALEAAGAPWTPGRLPELK